MIGLIIEAIYDALNAEFGDIAVYKDECVQGFEISSFSVYCLNTNRYLYPSERRLHTNQFNIRYSPAAPDNDGARDECLNVAERLQECLELIVAEDGTAFMGSSVHYEIADNNLHYFVNYDFFTRKKKTLTKMGELRNSFKQKR